MNFNSAKLCQDKHILIWRVNYKVVNLSLSQKSLPGFDVLSFWYYLFECNWRWRFETYYIYLFCIIQNFWLLENAIWKFFLGLQDVIVGSICQVVKIDSAWTIRNDYKLAICCYYNIVYLVYSQTYGSTCYEKLSSIEKLNLTRVAS